MKTAGVKKMEQTMKERITNNLQEALCPFGYLDVQKCAVVGEEVNYSGEDIADIIYDFADGTGTKMEDIDPVGVLYDHILQVAAENIEEVLKVDILNTGIFVFGNYMCTEFSDYEKTKEVLIKEMKKKSIKYAHFDTPEVKFLFSEIEFTEEDLQ